MTAADGATAWRREDLERIGGAEEIQLASRRPDGSLRSCVTMRVTGAGSDLYVRSAYGPDNPWYRHATGSGNRPDPGRRHRTGRLVRPAIRRQLREVRLTAAESGRAARVLQQCTAG